MDSSNDKNDLYLSLISAMSHDVVGPLRWVVSLLDVLTQDNALSQAQRQDYLNTALSSLRGSLGTMESVLGFARQMNALGDEIPENKELKLFPLLREKVDAISVAYDWVDIDLDCPKNITHKSEPVILGIALENIIVNAAKYSCGDSDVFVEVESDEGKVKIKVINSSESVSPELLCALNQGKTITRDSRVSIGVSVSKKLLESIGADLHFSYQEQGFVVAEVTIQA